MRRRIFAQSTGNTPRDERRMVTLGAMEPSPGLARFSEVVGRDDFSLDHAALLIGAWDYPERDLEAYREMLDGIASSRRPDVARAPNGIGRARAISDCAVRSPRLRAATRATTTIREQLPVRSHRPRRRHSDLAVGRLPRGRAPRRRARAGRELPGSLPRPRRDRGRVAVPRSVHARPHAHAGRSRRRCCARRRRRMPCSSRA